MILQAPPYDPMSKTEIKEAFHKDRNFKMDISSLKTQDDIKEKMIQCWNSDPSQRPAFSEINKFFENYGKNIYCEYHEV